MHAVASVQQKYNCFLVLLTVQEQIPFFVLSMGDYDNTSTG